MSSDRNAVLSPPVEVVMAISETAIRRAVFSANGNRRPPIPMRIAIASSIRRLPIASPRQPATTLDSVPPAMIALKTRPASNGVKSSRSR